METTLDQREHATIVSITGSLDALTAADLNRVLAEQIGQGKIRLVGDFSGLDYSSSAGLRVILRTLKETRQRGGDFRLAAVQHNVKKVLDLGGFTALLKIYPDVEAAVASYAG